MPRKKRVAPVQVQEQSFEAKTLEEMVCHRLSHIDIHMEHNGDYTVDIVCSCGERRSFGRSAWERICDVIQKAAEAEKADASN